MSVEAQDAQYSNLSASDNKYQDADEKYNDNTQSTMRTEETTKPCETDQSKDEESNTLFDKVDDFNQTLENTNLINDLILSPDQILNAITDLQENTPIIQENIEKRKSPQLIDYGDYFSDLPESSKTQNLMNIEPSDAPIDKESQELIDKLIAEDKQQLSLQNKSNSEQNKTTAQNPYNLNIDKHKSQYFQSKKQDQQEEQQQDAKEMFSDMTNKLKKKFSGIFNKNQGQSMGLSQQEQLANQQFLKESLQKMKQNKNRSFKEKIEDDAGVIEEFIFIYPRSAQIADQDFLVQFDLFKDLQQDRVQDSEDKVEDPNQIDSSGNGSKRQQRPKRSGIQIHNRKYLKKKPNELEEEYQMIQHANQQQQLDSNSLEFSPQAGSSTEGYIRNQGKEYNFWSPVDSLNDKQAFEVVSDQDDSFKEKGEQAVQKMKENAAEAKKKMQEVGNLFSKKLSTFF